MPCTIILYTAEKDQVKEHQQVLVDASKCESEEKELVKLLNLSPKFRNDNVKQIDMDPTGH